MEGTLEIFKASGTRLRVGPCCDSCGLEFEAYAVVVATTKAEALGLLLDAYPQSFASDWSLEVVDVSKPGVSEH